ncbi:Dyp-type peroxidase [Streptomyces sp. HUAS TT20]|uniref:Dyp-type peroxidase n=1 Tax=Streptomyces sp. HUAS TT20 TaxID=3447509 RepID=UPI0021DA616B|nr:Dyp-type peroxidase [Streptomyces sp. HUAS 15-9]UXY30580.1 Dyp-type peroxidase [Streptomyces sp. HUAS 15-9]
MSTPLPLRNSTEIQGDILAGFKKDYMTLLFLQFGDMTAARNWLAELVPNVATTQQVAAFNAKFHRARKNSAGDDPKNLKATWLGLSLTHPGMLFLTGKEKVFDKVPTGGTIQAFVQGSAARCKALGDTGCNDPKHWIFGADHRPVIHAVLTVAADLDLDRTTELNRQLEAASRAGVLIVHQQNGATLPGNRRGNEHFGFKDGVSEPFVVGFDDAAEAKGARMIPAGQFVLGSDDTPLPTGAPEWMKYGSFQVVRRLAQDVPGWWAQVNAELQKLKEAKVVGENTKSEWLAARLVGRWRCGASVAKFPDQSPPPGTKPDNDLSFKDDLDGVTTPLFSHLRKTAPRDGLVDGGKLVEEKFMDLRRIIRRGIPYGAPFDPANGDGGGPDEQRGLLFVCYQANLATQFEFIQADWVNDPNFPHDRDPKPGPDPMVSGQLPGVARGEVAFESRVNGDRNTTTLHFKPFVTTEGSVYAFTPSISTLRGLSRGRLEAAVPDNSGQTGTQQWETTSTTGGETRPPRPPVQPGPVDEILPWPDSEERDWTFSGRTVRVVTTGAAETGALTTGSDDSTGVVTDTAADLSTWPALAGVEQVDAIVPVPDEQSVNGESSYWLFHTVGGTQVYRRINISCDARHTSRSIGDDRALSAWRSLKDVTRVDAVLPVPDQRRVDGKTQYWLFHTTAQGQRYRLISIADGGMHTDEVVRTDRDLTQWTSLRGVTKIDALHFVPGKYRMNGQTWTWVFHDRQYRLISIADGFGHADTLLREDRPNTAWFRGA